MTLSPQAQAELDRIRRERNAREGARLDTAQPFNGGRPELRPSERFHLEKYETIKLLTAPNYLVKGILPREGISVIWGEPKCGKSFWLFDLYMHIALGLSYRGRKVRQGSVVYLALEGGGGFRSRVEAWRRHHAGEASDAPFYLLPVPVDLIVDHPQLIAAIRAQVGTPAVVAIDTLNRALNGNENDSADMAKLIRAGDAIRAAFDCSLPFAHHCGIAGGRPRGHSSLTGADDAQIAIHRDGESGIITAKVEHMKDGQAGATVVSRLLSVDLGTDDDGDPIISCVIVPSDEGEARQKVKLPDNVQLALNALKSAIVDHGEKPPASNHIPQQPDIRVCPVELFRSYYYKLKVGEPDTKQKAFVRAVEKLQRLHIIGIHGDLVWLPDMPDMARHHESCPGTLSRTDRDTP